jgi:hypothetical protein
MILYLFDNKTSPLPFSINGEGFKELWFKPSPFMERVCVRLYLNYFANSQFDMGQEF